MTFNVSVLVLNAEAEAFISLLDGGTCELRTGVQPAAITDAATGTLIAVVTMESIALATPAVAGVATLNLPLTDGIALANGDIGWGRFLTSGSDPVFDGSTTLNGGGGEIIATTIGMLVGESVNIESMSYSRAL